MNSIKIVLTIIAISFLTACTNLKDVREYATESAKFSSYTELTTRFRDTYSREQPYVTGKVEEAAKANDLGRKAAYADLIKIQQSVSLYMVTLAQLAGEDSFGVSKEIESVKGGIKAYPDLNITSKQVDAFSNITQIITKWATSAYQEQAVRKMIKEGNAPLQNLLEGMISLVEIYKKTNENEKQKVLGFFEINLNFVDPKKDAILIALSRAQVQTKTTEYGNVQNKYDLAEKGLKNIADGHKKLYENIDKLSAADIKSSLRGFSKDIKSIRESLATIQ